MDTIAIIPARGGSKGLHRKNILPLLGHPLIAYSIIAAKLAQSISRIIVSTDCPEIAAISRKYGAEVPFLRPSEFSTDSSTDREFLLHAVQWFAKYEGFRPEYLVHLRPTTPLRDPLLINQAVKQIKNSTVATSLRSAHLAMKTPYKWFEMDSEGFFKGIRPHDVRPEYFNLPRQSFAAVYDPNGYVDVVRSSQLLSSQSLHGHSMMGFVTEHTHDIDSSADFEFLDYWVRRNGSMLLPYLQKLANPEIEKKNE